MLMRPPLSPFIAMPKPVPSPSAPPSIASAGTRTPSKTTCAVGWAFQPILCSLAPKLSPGVSFSTTNAEMPRGPSPPVRAITMYTSDVPAPEMNCLTPSST